MVFFPQNSRGGYTPRNRRSAQYTGPIRRNAFLNGPTPTRGRVYPVQTGGRGVQSPFVGGRSFVQPYTDSFQQQQQGVGFESFQQANGIQNVMGHVNNISNGLGMISQLGSVMNMFRGL